MWSTQVPFLVLKCCQGSSWAIRSSYIVQVLNRHTRTADICPTPPHFPAGAKWVFLVDILPPLPGRQPLHQRRRRRPPSLHFPAGSQLGCFWLSPCQHCLIVQISAPGALKGRSSSFLLFF